jgi:hypothetical protein
MSRSLTGAPASETASPSWGAVGNGIRSRRATLLPQRAPSCCELPSTLESGLRARRLGEQH